MCPFGKSTIASVSFLPNFAKEKLKLPAKVGVGSFSGFRDFTPLLQLLISSSHSCPANA